MAGLTEGTIHHKDVWCIYPELKLAMLNVNT
jgi:hypothetical protein